jgi:hypothetical protein
MITKLTGEYLNFYLINPGIGLNLKSGSVRLPNGKARVEPGLLKCLSNCDSVAKITSDHNTY